MPGSSDDILNEEQIKGWTPQWVNYYDEYWYLGNLYCGNAVRVYVDDDSIYIDSGSLNISQVKLWETKVLPAITKKWEEVNAERVEKERIQREELEALLFSASGVEAIKRYATDYDFKKRVNVHLDL